MQKLKCQLISLYFEIILIVQTVNVPLMWISIIAILLSLMVYKDGISKGAINPQQVYSPFKEEPVPPVFKTEDLQLRKVFNRITSLGLPINKGSSFNEYQLNIIAVEGVNLELDPITKNIDSYDDVVLLVGVNSEGNLKEYGRFRATTESSPIWTNYPMNPLGAARLVNDTVHEDIWIVGRHKNQYPALVQSQPVDVARDANKDYLRDGDRVIKGNYGINFHGATSEDNVGRWSAGCVVIQGMNNFRKAMLLIIEHSQPGESYDLILLSGLE